MYIPKYAEINDSNLISQFIEDHSFGTLVGTHNGIPSAGHYPFLLEKNPVDGGVTLWTHLARTNPQWRELGESKNALIIFTGPHSYISPTVYLNPLNVPTWSYTAVHVSADVHVVTSPELAKALMKKLVQHFEKRNGSAWPYELPEQFHERLLSAIVWLRFDIVKVEAKFKLSQNRDKPDYDSVIQDFEKRKSDNDQELLKYMRATTPEKNR